jgi:hypothetical protein
VKLDAERDVSFLPLQAQISTSGANSGMVTDAIVMYASNVTVLRTASKVLASARAESKCIQDKVRYLELVIIGCRPL